jgi:hypothetical protein
MSHRHRAAAGLLLLVVALAGCAGGAGVGNGARNAAFNDLRGQLDTFVTLSKTGFDQDPEKFFSAGAVQLRGIRRAQVAWLDAADAANLPETASRGTPSEATVKEFNASLEAWIKAQEEQARLSRPCRGKADPAACYQDVVKVNNDRWNATADRLNTATKALTAEANS